MGEPVSSLLLARTDSEPSQQSSEKSHHGHHNHLHQHERNNRQITRRSAAVATAQPSVVAEVTATVSYVQQIDVDSAGHTFSILSVLTSDAFQAILTASSITPTTTNPSGALSAATTTPSETSSSSGQNTSVATTSSPSTTATFTSLSSSTNSTTSASSSSSLSQSSTSSTVSSSLSSSETSLTSYTSSSSSYDPFKTAHSSSYGIPASASPQSTLASAAGGAAGSTTTGATASSTAVSGDDNPSGAGPTVSTSEVVGGVVGSVAGVAVIAMLFLMLLKWKKYRNGGVLSLGNGRDGAGQGDTMARGPPSQNSGAMTERPSYFAIPAALANLTSRSSRQTDLTASSTGGSERGFYRVSGRKLPSVLRTGGDGYGDGVPDQHTLTDLSFYRDSQGFYGGPGSPSFPAENNQIGSPIMRPSPARTPVTEQGPFPSPLIPDLDPFPPRPDVLGRSHPSHDGSHTSRFVEEV